MHRPSWRKSGSSAGLAKCPPLSLSGRCQSREAITSAVVLSDWFLTNGATWAATVRPPSRRRRLHRVVLDVDHDQGTSCRCLIHDNHLGCSDRYRSSSWSTPARQCRSRPTDEDCAHGKDPLGVTRWTPIRGRRSPAGPFVNRAHASSRAPPERDPGGPTPSTHDSADAPRMAATGLFSIHRCRPAGSGSVVT